VSCRRFSCRPVIAYDRNEFDPEITFELIETYGITIIGAVPTALRMMTEVDPDPYTLDSIRVIGGGEPFDAELRQWSQDVFGDVAVHEGYGQTEANSLISECEKLNRHRPDKLGVAGVGRDLEIVDPQTAEPDVPPGEIGEIAVRREGDLRSFLRIPESAGENSGHAEERLPSHR
jgi:acetyl-CoA synthetase